MFLKPLRVLFGLLGALLGASWGDLGASWGEIGWSWGDFWVISILDDFLERFWEQKGCPKERFLGGKTEQKSIKKRGANLRASWSRLGSKLARFPLRLGVKHVDFSLVFKGFREHPRFSQR